MQRGSDSFWAHVLWQVKGLRPEEFDSFPRMKKNWYIASEQIEMSDDPICNVYGKRGGK